MEHDQDDARLERLDNYLTGTDTPAERDAFECQLATDPQLAAIVEAVRAFGRAEGPHAGEWDTAAAWQAFRERMKTDRESMLRILRSSGEHAAYPWPAGPLRAWSLPGFGATILVILGLAAGGFYLRGQLRHPTATATSAATPASRQVATGRGERAVLNFADGSRVILGPESRLVMPSDFDLSARAGPREAYLEGQGYFQIRHNEHRTLRIVTSNAVTEDLGTAFVVIAYPASRATRVIVESGTVALERRGRPGRLPSDTAPLAVLHAGDLARVDSSGVATLSRVSVAPYTAWTTGTVVFDGTPLPTAVRELERWYDLDIRIADEALARRRLSGSFRNESDDEMLRELGDALGALVTRHGRSVLLSRFPSPPAGAK